MIPFQRHKHQNAGQDASGVGSCHRDAAHPAVQRAEDDMAGDEFESAFADHQGQAGQPPFALIGRTHQLQRGDRHQPVVNAGKTCQTKLLRGTQPYPEQ